MEQINRIELRGIIGHVKVQKIQDLSMARLSVATNYAYKDRNGTPIIETTWHDVVAWEGKDISASTLAELSRGDSVYVTGRLRGIRYTNSDGEERTAPQVYAHELTKIENAGTMQTEVNND